jgi:hypothetical protein
MLKVKVRRTGPTTSKMTGPESDAEMKVLSDTPLYSAELPLFFLDVGPNLAHFIFKYFAEKNRNPLIRSITFMSK